MPNIFLEKTLIPLIPIILSLAPWLSLLYIYKDNIFGPSYSENIFLLVQSEHLINEPSEPLYLPTSKRKKLQRNYQCNISNVIAVYNKACFLASQLNKQANGTKGWFNLSHISIPSKVESLIKNSKIDSTSPASNINKNQLIMKNNYFVLQISEGFYNQLTWSKDQLISLSLLDDEAKIFASFKPLFAINGRYIGLKTKYVLAKAIESSKLELKDEEIYPSTIRSIEANKCLHTAIDSVDKHLFNDCRFYKFSSSIHTKHNHWYDSISFNGELETAKQIEIDKYYLVELDQEYFARDIRNINLHLILNDSTNKAVVKFGNLYPTAFAIEDEKKIPFILTKR